MTNYATAKFVHRDKEDGSHDSICLTCLSTIASAQDQAELPREEEDHVCQFDFPARRTRVPRADADH
jgi:hypothetical protein